jgi:hypothetical protein
MVTEEAKEIIEKTIKNPEFIKEIAEAVDFFDCIVKIHTTDNIIILQALKSVLERRIAELNIMFWFIRIEAVENNIMKQIIGSTS